ncbi:MAG: hypothetical protein M1826_006910 [Phylliscum demangeonii]|nr:MAG: hypothetical protein M1826_006910 [Phylliscum demangeonii]
MSKVRSLDLRLDDAVKVDLPRLRSKTYLVVGFKDKRSESGTAATDMAGLGQPARSDARGYETVMLRPNGAGDGTLPAETIDVPITSLYILPRNWAPFQGRIHGHREVGYREAQDSGISNVARLRPTSPSSRTRVRPSSATAGRSGTGLFENMIFAVSYGSTGPNRQAEKTRIVKHITTHGGTVLEDSFRELFQKDGLPTFGQQQHAPRHPISDESNGLQVKARFKDAGFACVIADEHSRRVKYMQALALGLPCLAGRWIEDCVRQSSIVDWAPYLLPAGKSTYLGDAIRSRTLAYCPASDAPLSKTITATGPKLLAGRRVLFVDDKKAATSRDTYLFLLHVLSPSRIMRVPSIEAAEAILASSSRTNRHGRLDAEWDFLYLAGHELRRVTEDGKLSTPPLERKRKSGGDIGPGALSNKRRRGLHLHGERATSTDVPIGPLHEESGGMLVTGTERLKIKILNDEFLVQSLITGILLHG